MLKKANDKHTVTSQQVSEYNLGEYFDGIKKSEGNWKIKFLGCDAGLVLGRYKRKHVGSYDVVYLSSMDAHRVKECGELLREGGQVIVESVRFVQMAYL
jgi:hypothetical protein